MTDPSGKYLFGVPRVGVSGVFLLFGCPIAGAVVGVYGLLMIGCAEYIGPINEAGYQLAGTGPGDTNTSPSGTQST
jgi:hypothetical protein